MTHMFLGLIVMMIGVALTTVGGYLAKDGWESTSNAKKAALDFEANRARAFLAGYEAGLALASAIQGGNTSRQGAATVNAYLNDLGLSSVEYPADPLGSARDATPAVHFAQAVAGSLAGKDEKLKAAFVLGWYGVIATNTPTVANPSFSVKAYVQKAGFTLPTVAVSDAEIIESIAADGKMLLSNRQAVP